MKKRSPSLRLGPAAQKQHDCICTTTAGSASVSVKAPEWGFLKFHARSHQRAPIRVSLAPLAFLASDDDRVVTIPPPTANAPAVPPRGPPQYRKSGRHHYGSADLVWDGLSLKRLSKRGRTVATVKPDFKWPGMYRVRCGGELSDMVNLTRAKDAALARALQRLNGAAP